MPASKTQKVAGGGLAAALLLAIPLVTQWEGTKTKPYLDPINILTVCTGETRVAMREYSKAECSNMLKQALANDYAPVVLRCTPVLRERPYQLAAAISLTYNIGGASYCRSTVAKRFNAGNIRGGCDSFLAWNRAGGRVMQGLTNRRNDERKLCLTGVA